MDYNQILKEIEEQILKADNKILELNIKKKALQTLHKKAKKKQKEEESFRGSLDILK